jgi:hypothetical protein
MSKMIKLLISICILLAPLSSTALAENSPSPTQLHGIANGTPFYDPEAQQCTTQDGGAAGTGPLYGMKYPAITDDAAFAAAIDKYIKDVHPDSPFIRHGADFVSLGKAANVNPLLAVAQGQLESQLGTTSYARQHKNAFGLGGTSPINFSSYLDSLEYFYSKKPGYAASPQLFTDLNAYVHLYAPNGDGNNDEEDYKKTVINIEKEVARNLPTSSQLSQNQQSLGNKIAALFIPNAQAAAGPGLGNELKGHKIPAAEGGSHEDNDDFNYAYGQPRGAAETDYHMTMRWRIAKWNWDGTTATGPETDDNGFFNKHPRVLVTNPRTHKNVILAVNEAGPAPWAGSKDNNPNKKPSYWTNPQDGTPDAYDGRVSGMTQKGVEALGLKEQTYGEGDKLLYAWAPDQNATPGPTDIAVGTQAPQSSTCVGATDASVGNIDFIKKNSFPNRTDKFTPTALAIHYSETRTSDGIDGLVSALKSNSTCEGGCAVQVGIDGDGKVYQLTRTLDTTGAHIYNFNHNAIGIEVIGMNEQQLLDNQAQFDAVVAASVKIMKQYNIQVEPELDSKKGLVGHFECDLWSRSKGLREDGHTDPGSRYMNKVRQAVKQAMGQ